MGPDWMQILPLLTDAHCHPNDAFHGKDIQRAAREINLLAIGQVCVMSSSLQSQSKTEELFHLQPKRVIPAFGLHPWYTATISTNGNLDKLTHYSSVLSRKKYNKNSHHQRSRPQLEHEADQQEVIRGWVLAHLECLPTPIKLDEFISGLKSRLLMYPSSIVGEIGLDKAFQFHLDLSSFPSSSTQRDGDDENKVLKTDFQISLDHQLIILKSQIELAIELFRPISLHCVQAPIELLDLLRSLKEEWGARFTGVPTKTNPSSSRKKKPNKHSTSLLQGDTNNPDSLLNDLMSSAHLGNTRSPPDLKKSKLEFGQVSQHQQDGLSPPSNGIKICWHSPNISVEILQSAIKILPQNMYFSYSNDLALLFEAKRGGQPHYDHDDEDEAGEPKMTDAYWNKYYSKRISNCIRSTPKDRLLIESDHGSDPALMDGKLIKVLRWIQFLQFPDGSDGQEDALDRLVAQIQSNWNQFHSFVPPG